MNVLAGRSARLYLNGEDVGPVTDWSFMVDGTDLEVDDPVHIEGQPPDARFAVASKETRFAGGTVTSRCEVTTVVHGKAGRALLRFIRQVARLCTPFAHGRGLKKPRGRKGKARVREMWRLAHVINRDARTKLKGGPS